MDIGNMNCSDKPMWKMLAEIIMISHEITMSCGILACESLRKMDHPRDCIVDKRMFKPKRVSLARNRWLEWIYVRDSWYILVGVKKAIDI